MKVTVQHCPTEGTQKRRKPWRVQWYVSRKKRRKFFLKQREANEYRRTILQATEKDGKIAAQALGPAELREYIIARKMLEGTNWGLLGAVLAFIEGEGRRRPTSPGFNTVEEAIGKFVLSRHGRRKRPPRERTLATYRTILGYFAKRYPGMHWHQVSEAEIEQWLKTVTPGARRKRLNYLKIFYRWSLKERYIEFNPVERLIVPYEQPAANTVIKHGDYLSVDEARALLDAGTAKSLPAIVLGLFAGLRPEEIGCSGMKKPTLQWKDIQFSERRIRVPPEVSKTGRARVIENLPPAIWVWLKPYRNAKGNVVLDYRGSMNRARKRAAKTKAGKRLWKHWPYDGTRHTFATYYVALTGNLGIVAKALGHASLSMLLDTYDGVETKINAVKFFALRPQKNCK